MSDLGRLQTKMEKGDREPERKIKGGRETERETDTESEEGKMREREEEIQRQ